MTSLLDCKKLPGQNNIMQPNRTGKEWKKHRNSGGRGLEKDQQSRMEESGQVWVGPASGQYLGQSRAAFFLGRSPVGADGKGCGKQIVAEAKSHLLHCLLGAMASPAVTGMPVEARVWFDGAE